MATERVTQPARPGLVTVWVPDETEFNVVPGNDEHNRARSTARLDLDLHARRRDRAWLVREDTQLEYPRADGSTGSLYPDILLALDVRISPKDSYDIARVGKPPELVLEVLSPSTAGEDRGAKMLAFAQMGVGLYVVFDLRKGDRPMLAGYRLGGDGGYQPLPRAWNGGIWLPALGLGMVAEPAASSAGRVPCVRLYDADGAPLPHFDEEATIERAERRRAEEARNRAEEARLAEQQTRLQLESEVARLRALLEERRPEPGG